MSEQSIPEFRELPGFPGYRVSNTGRVQSRFVRHGGIGGSWVLGED